MSGSTVGVGLQVSGTLVPATNPFTVNQGAAGTAAWLVSVTNLPATQPVSGTVTANLGTLNGAATAANQANVQSAPGTGAGTLVGVQGASGGVPISVSWSGQTVAVTGTTTANQGAPGSSPWLVSWTGQSVSVSNFPATQPVSGTVTANFGTLNGAATAANQTNVQSAAGTPATTALTVQGVSGGVAQPVIQTPLTFTDRSGSITTPSTWQTVMSANSTRQFARVSNNSTAILYVYDKNSGTPTTSNSFALQPGAAYVWDVKVPSGAIQVWSATGGATFEAVEG